MVLGEGRVYDAEADDLRDLHLRQRRADEPARRAADRSRSTAGRCAWSTCAGWCRSTRPSSREQAANAKRILVVDEGRHSAGVGEGIITAIVEGGYGAQAVAARGRRRHVHAAGGRGVPGDSVGRADHRRGGRAGERLISRSLKPSSWRSTADARGNAGVSVQGHRAAALRAARCRRRAARTGIALQRQHRQCAASRSALTIVPEHAFAIADFAADGDRAAGFEQRQPALGLAEEMRARDDFLARDSSPS